MQIDNFNITVFKDATTRRSQMSFVADDTEAEAWDGTASEDAIRRGPAGGPLQQGQRRPAAAPDQRCHTHRIVGRHHQGVCGPCRCLAWVLAADNGVARTP